MTREEAIETIKDICLTTEQLTRIEKALECLLSQPSLPSNLDEAAELSANDAMIKRQFPSVVYNTGLKCFDHADLIKQFKAGAEWMAEQGYVKECTIYKTPLNGPAGICMNLHESDGFNLGDKVTVQIRKKQ